MEFFPRSAGNSRVNECPASILAKHVGKLPDNPTSNIEYSTPRWGSAEVRSCRRPSNFQFWVARPEFVSVRLPAASKTGGPKVIDADISNRSSG